MDSLHPLFLIAILGSAAIITIFVAFLAWANWDVLKGKK